MRLNLWPSADLKGVEFLSSATEKLDKLAISLGIDPDKVEISLSRKVSTEEKEAKKRGRAYTRVLCGGYQYIGDTLCIDIDDKLAGKSLNNALSMVFTDVETTTKLAYTNLILEASKLLTYAALDKIDWDKFNLSKYGEHVSTFMYLFVNSMYRMEDYSLRDFHMVVPDPYSTFNSCENCSDSQLEAKMLEVFDSVCYRICSSELSFCKYADETYGKNRKLNKLDTIVAELERAYRRNNGQFI